MSRLSKLGGTVAFLCLTVTQVPADDAGLVLSGGSGEWFTPVTAFMSDSSLESRYLVIKGRLTNSSGSEVVENIRCFAELEVNFQNGKSVKFASEDICSDAGMAAVAAQLGQPILTAPLILGPGETHAIDTDEGGAIMAAMRGPAVPGKYKPYPVKSTTLKIVVHSNSVFGDEVKKTITHSPIPGPTHSSKFEL